MKRRTMMNGKHGKYMTVLYTRPCDCGGNCLYCIKETGVTRSTIPNQDTLLASQVNWSSAKQLLARCEAEGIVLGQGNKFELRIKGNSFTNYPPEYLEGYIKDVYDLLNGWVSDSFEEAFIGQENAADRVVQIVIETRPDQITEQWCDYMRKWGVTTVEIGVQSLNDGVLAANNRGHLTDVVRSAAKLIRSYGFELGFQVMLGLWGSSREIDVDMLTRALWQKEYYPDTLKIYPTLLLPNEDAQRPMYDLFHKGEWLPIGDEEYDLFLREVLPYIPYDVHVNRLQRIFTESEVAYGPFKIIDRTKYRGISKCMWQRSFQNSGCDYTDIKDWHYVITSHENHYTVQCVTNDDVLLGYGRLSVDGNVGYLRDLRVLGDPIHIGETSDRTQSLQHMGIGREMLSTLEAIAKNGGANECVIYSSAGCVSYFTKLGYKKVNHYTLVKDITDCIK